jgi:hypothetical protein
LPDLAAFVNTLPSIGDTLSKYSPLTGGVNLPPIKLSYLDLKVGRVTIVDIALIVLEANTRLICLNFIVYLSQIVAQN